MAALASVKRGVPGACFYRGRGWLWEEIVPAAVAAVAVLWAKSCADMGEKMGARAVGDAGSRAYVRGRRGQLGARALRSSARQPWRFRASGLRWKEVGRKMGTGGRIFIRRSGEMGRRGSLWAV